MPSLEAKPKEACRYDIVSLGEIMLRLDPGEGRIRTARTFRAWEGGGEYNVARGLRRCFGLRAAVVTALVRNEVGLLLEDLILQGGVDTSFIEWLPSDGIGRAARNGLNFTERGFGLRGAVGCSDRGHSAASQLTVGTIDWRHLFGTLGVRWFHTGGIFAALSDTTAEVVVEAARIAREHGTLVSYDLNYRPSLWDGHGGLDRCREVNRVIAPWVDVLVGNEGHFDACLGLGGDDLQATLGAAVEAYPNLRAVAATRRHVHSATRHDWGAVCWHDGHVHTATHRPHLEILDRVGGGDSFASGLIYGLLELGDAALAVEYGAAHGALAMTTPGDTTMASLAEVEHLVRGGNAGVDR